MDYLEHRTFKSAFLNRIEKRNFSLQFTVVINNKKEKQTYGRVISRGQPGAYVWVKRS